MAILRPYSRFAWKAEIEHLDKVLEKVFRINALESRLQAVHGTGTG
jgi:hypothetical protein